MAVAFDLGQFSRQICWLIWVGLVVLVIGVGVFAWRVRWWVGVGYGVLVLAVLNSV